MQNIKAAVKTQEEHVVGRDVLDISKFVYHVELRQNGQGLQPHAERPQKIDWVQRFVRDYRSQQSSHIEVVVWKIVRLTIQTQTVRLFEFHEVNCVGSEGNEHNLHHEDVKGFPAEKEIDIAGQEYSQKQLLSAIGQS